MTVKQSRLLYILLSGAAIAAGLSLTPNVQAQDKELSIGFIAPLTGPFAQVGKDMVDGFNMYLDEAKGEFAGAKVKFIVEDDQAKPDTGVTKAKKLILQDKVHMLVGGVLASTGYALAPVSTADKTVYLPSVPASDDLTQRDASKFPYVIRTGWTGLRLMRPRMSAWRQMPLSTIRTRCVIAGPTRSRRSSRWSSMTRPGSTSRSGTSPSRGTRWTSSTWA